jgi:uncharacterized membrane protein
VDTYEKRPINQLWFLSYLVIIIAITVVGLIRYPDLPNQIPIHYNITGQVDRYAEKSIGTFLMMPIMQIIMGLLLFGIYYAILHAKNQSGGGDAEEGLKKGRSFKVIISNFIFLTGLMMMLIFGVSQLSMLGIIGISFTIAAPIIELVVVFAFIAYIIIKVGQSGSRIGTSKSTPSKAAANDDSYWKLGVFYFNRDDPTIFLEKRFGIGYTLNFGNPISWIVIAALIVLIGGSLILPLILK